MIPKTRPGIWLMQVTRIVRGVGPVHCWQDGPSWLDQPEMEVGASSTCMRALGHLGKHDFIPDGGIGVTFAAAADPPR